MDTLERVIVIVAKQLSRDPSEFSQKTDLLEAGYESLDVIETIFALEEEFDININFNANLSEEGASMTVGDLAELVDERLAKSDNL